MACASVCAARSAKARRRRDQIGEIPLDNFAVSNGATEFSIPAMNLYAVIDLQREK